MTNNIEQEFFEAFNVPKEWKCKDTSHGELCKGICEKCEFGILTYRKITPEIVLGLINIILRTKGEFRIIGSFSSIDVMKDSVCQACIQLQPEIQEEVRRLFNDK